MGFLYVFGRVIGLPDCGTPSGWMSGEEMTGGISWHDESCAWLLECEG